jgi:GNAT superfamily N-acetyltransferase
MTEAVLDVELLKPTQWWVLRATRLRALRDSPRAYTSTLAVESAWRRQQWRNQLAAGTWVVAVEGADRIGLAGLVQSPTEPPHVEWAWVAPAHRRRGVLRSLVEALAGEAGKIGVPALQLWVLKDNTDALAAYRKLGFIETGEEQKISDVGSPQADPTPRYELRLRREL